MTSGGFDAHWRMERASGIGLASERDSKKTIEHVFRGSGRMNGHQWPGDSPLRTGVCAAWNPCHERDGRRTMPKLDVLSFARELDRLGLRLSTFRHLDGTVRLYRWRTMNYSQNEALIRRLWNEHIGEDEKSLNQLAESLENLGSKLFEADAA